MDANAPFSVSFWHARLNNLPLLQFYTQSTHTLHTHSPHLILCTVVSLPLLMGNNDCVSTTRPPRAAPFRVSLSPFPSWCCTFRTRPLCNCVCVTLRESHTLYEQWARLICCHFSQIYLFCFLAHFSSALYPLCGCMLQLPHGKCCINIIWFIYFLYLLSVAWATLSRCLLLSYCVTEIILSWFLFVYFFYLLMLTLHRAENTTTGLAIYLIFFLPLFQFRFALLIA